MARKTVNRMSGYVIRGTSASACPTSDVKVVRRGEPLHQRNVRNHFVTEIDLAVDLTATDTYPPVQSHPTRATFVPIGA